MNEIYSSYRLKVARAKQLIDELQEAVSTFFAGKPFSVYIEDDAGTGLRLWKVKVREEIPVMWSAVVGDVVHNLRSALDLLAVQIVRHCEPTRKKFAEVQFPIASDENWFEKGLERRMGRISPDAKKVIREMKPYKGGNSRFYELSEINNIDKHRAVILVGGAQSSFGMAWELFDVYENREIGTGIVKSISTVPRPPKVFHIDSELSQRKFPIVDGSILLSNPYRSVVDDLHEFRFDVAFGADQIFDGEFLIPTLRELCSFVETIIEEAEVKILFSVL